MLPSKRQLNNMQSEEACNPFQTSGISKLAANSWHDATIEIL
jgi:hypothetical protein